jgi:23S rRNA pseudouridine2605 synthase
VIERLQKILARGGIASRRAAESLILEGRVRVNGRIVRELGAKADPRTDRVEVDGTRVVAEDLVYLLFHKPRGVVTTLSDPEGRKTVRDALLAIKQRVFPVGRLDFATSGALLLTNDGEFSDGLLHPKRAVPKTYVLKVQGEMQLGDLARWQKGVELDDGKTLPAEVVILRHEGGKTWLEVTITEGRNHQLRRMGEATGFPVMRLARISFAGVSTEGLKPGEWRPLTRDELVALKKSYGVPRKLPHGDGTVLERAPRRSVQGSRAGSRTGARKRGGYGSKGASSARPSSGGPSRSKSSADARSKAGADARRGHVDGEPARPRRSR